MSVNMINFRTFRFRMNKRDLLSLLIWVILAVELIFVLSTLDLHFLVVVWFMVAVLAESAWVVWLIGVPTLACHPRVALRMIAWMAHIFCSLFSSEMLTNTHIGNCFLKWLPISFSLMVKIFTELAILIIELRVEIKFFCKYSLFIRTLVIINGHPMSAHTAFNNDFVLLWDKVQSLFYQLTNFLLSFVQEFDLLANISRLLA